MDRVGRAISRSMSKIRRAGRIKECFHHRRDECSGPIKQSHSLQRNGRLSLIEGLVGGQRVVYTFSSIRSSEQQYVQNLKPVGAAKASTFFGFCDWHDSVLFSPIENLAFDGSAKHLFLHSYRSFAHSFHLQREHDRSIQADESAYEDLPANWRSRCKHPLF